MIATNAELIAELQKLPPDLAPVVTITTGSLNITNGTVTQVVVGSVAIGPQDFGKCIVITGAQE